MTNKTLTLDEAATDLARKHYELEDGIRHIFRIRAKQEHAAVNGERIMLLEVNDNTFPSGVLPLYFAENDAVPYPCVIIAVTPDEFEKIKTAELSLPEGWEIGAEFPRPLDVVGVE